MPFRGVWTPANLYWIYHNNPEAENHHPCPEWFHQEPQLLNPPTEDPLQRHPRQYLCPLPLHWQNWSNHSWSPINQNWIPTLEQPKRRRDTNSENILISVPEFLHQALQISPPYTSIGIWPGQKSFVLSRTASLTMMSHSPNPVQSPLLYLY